MLFVFQDKQETRNLYECPVYKTRQRGRNIIIRAVNVQFIVKLSRPNLHLDFQLKNKRKTGKMGSGGGLATSSDIDTYYTIIHIILVYYSQFILIISTIFISIKKYMFYDFFLKVSKIIIKFII